MVPERYVWLVWSVSFLAPWLLLFGLFPGYRAVMWWSSVLAVPFGCSESLFLGRYWEPPSLFDLARSAHFDLESFIFCFGIGGVASVGYNVVARQPLRLRAVTAADLHRRALQGAALAIIVPVFGVVVFVWREPIWAGCAGFGTGVLARLIARPDLTAKTCLGGLLFLVYYVAFLLYLNELAPGYLQQVWLTTGPAATRVLGLPLTELLFALGFGMYWSGLFEQIDGALAMPAAASQRAH
jgi:hypothetical protein